MKAHFGKSLPGFASRWERLISLCVHLVSFYISCNFLYACVDNSQTPFERRQCGRLIRLISLSLLKIFE